MRSHRSSTTSRSGAFVDDWAADLHDRDADAGRAVKAMVREHRHRFAACPATLVHGEPSPAHVRFDGRVVVGLLDWELAQAAPGEFDLVWAERDFLRTPFGGEVDGELVTALRRGYEVVRPLRPGSTFRSAVYRAAFAMRDLTVLRDLPADADIDVADHRPSMRSYLFDCVDDAAAAADD